MIGFAAGPAREVAGQGPQVAIGQEVKTAGIAALTRALPDHLQQTDQAALLELFGQAQDLGIDGRLDLARDGTGGRPIDEGQNPEHDGIEKKQIDQGETKGPGFNQACGPGHGSR